MKKKRKSRVALFALSIIALFLVGAFAVTVWLYRGDFQGIFKTGDGKVSSEEKVEPQQEILEEERKQLEEILKRRK